VNVVGVPTVAGLVKVKGALVAELVGIDTGVGPGPPGPAPTVIIAPPVWLNATVTALAAVTPLPNASVKLRVTWRVVGWLCDVSDGQETNDKGPGAKGAAATVISAGVQVRWEPCDTFIVVEPALTSVMLATPTPEAKLTVAGNVGVVPLGELDAPEKMSVLEPVYVASVEPSLAIAVTVRLNGWPAVAVVGEGVTVNGVKTPSVRMVAENT
jgi:hypothetical protein